MLDSQLYLAIVAMISDRAIVDSFFLNFMLFYENPNGITPGAEMEYTARLRGARLSSVLSSVGWDSYEGILLRAQNSGDSDKRWVIHKDMATLLKHGAEKIREGENVTEARCDGFIFVHVCSPECYRIGS
jgi:hypothetical protein